MAIVFNQTTKLKWVANNTKKYKELGYAYTKQYDEFDVDIKHLPLHSPALVKMVCDCCNQIFEAKYTGRSSRKNQFCGRKCQDNFLIGKPPPNKDRMKTNCGFCEKEIERTRSEIEKKDNLFCSHECANTFRRGKGENRVERISLNCSHCDKCIERTKAQIKLAKNHFCDKACADNFMKGQIKERKGVYYSCHFCGEENYLPQYRIKDTERNFCNQKCYSSWSKTEEYRQTIGSRENPDTYVTKNCNVCDKKVTRKHWEFNSNGTCICSDECKSVYSKTLNPKGNRITVNCDQCGKEDKVVESKAKKNKWHFCSRDCYSDFRSEKLRGDKIHNYQDIKSNCINCSKEIKITKYKLESRNNNFCGQQCYYEYRSKYYIGEMHPQFGTKKTPEQIERMREITAWRISNGEIPTTNTSIHRKTKKLLEEINADFEEEKYFRYYSLDFYLKGMNLGIEVMGDYWHASPIKYNDYDVLNNTQKNDVRKDKSKRTYLYKYHKVNVLYLWENDINKNPELCFKLIKLFILNNGNLKDYNSFNYEIHNSTLRIKEKLVQPYFLRKNTKYQVC